MSSSGTSSSESSGGASSGKKGYSNREKALFASLGVLSTLLIGSLTLVSSSVFGSSFCSESAPIPAPGPLEQQQSCQCPAPVKKVCPVSAPATPKSCSSYTPPKPPYPCLNYDDGEDNSYNQYRCDFFPGTSPNKLLTGFIDFRQFTNKNGNVFNIKLIKLYNVYKDPKSNGNISLHFYEFTNNLNSCDEMGNIYNPDDPVGWFRPGALGAFGPNIPVTWDSNGTGRVSHEQRQGRRPWDQQLDSNKKSHTIGPYTLLGRGIVLRSMHGQGMKSRTDKYRWPTYEGEGMRLGCCTLGRFARQTEIF